MGTEPIKVDNWLGKGGETLFHRTFIDQVIWTSYDAVDNAIGVGFKIDQAPFTDYDILDFEVTDFTPSSLRRHMMRFSTDDLLSVDSANNYAFCFQGSTPGGGMRVDSPGSNGFYFYSDDGAAGTYHRSSISMLRPQDAAPTKIDFGMAGRFADTAQTVGGGIYLPSIAITHVLLICEGAEVISSAAIRAFGRNLPS